MKYNIDILHPVNNDIHEIYEYLFDLGDNSSKKFRESFEKFIEQVSNMPYMFSKYEHNPNYRKTAIEFGYLVFYSINEKKKEVTICRVLHSKRNIKDLI